MGAVKMGTGKKRHTLPNWWFIPPPWNQKSPIHLFAPPIGAKHTDSRKPAETIQMIGRPGAEFPKMVRIDMGWADIEIRNGKEISFKSHGGRTDVGKRDPAPTRGMSIGDEDAGQTASTILEEGDIIGVDGYAVTTKNSEKRSSKPEPRKKKKMSSWDYMTTLRGFRP
jgi:hypothetical protein